MLTLQFSEALTIAKSGLKELNIEIPSESPLPQEFMIPEYERSLKILGNRKPQELLSLDEIHDDIILAQINLMSKALPPSIRCDLFLNSYLSIKLVNMFMENGNAPFAVIAYQTYGYLLFSFKEYRTGIDFSKTSLMLAEKYNNNSLSAISFFLYAMIFCHIENHYNDAVDYLNKSIELCKESGNLEYLGNNIWVHPYMNFFTGKKLNTILYESLDNFEIDRTRIQQEQTNQIVFAWNDLVQKLIGNLKINDKESKKQDANNIQNMQDANNTFGLALYYCSKPILYYILDQYSDGMKIVLEIESKGYLVSLPGNPPTCVYHFYKALLIINNYLQSSKAEKQKYIDLIEESLDLLTQLLELGATNYKNKQLLILAELERIGKEDKNIQLLLSKYIDNNQPQKKQNKSITILYELSINTAREQGFTHEQAIACECTAKYYLSLGVKTAAAAYMVKARHYYEKWGCKPKVQQLEHDYPDLLISAKLSREDKKHNGQISIDKEIIISSSDSSSSGGAYLDLGTVMKASHTFARETNMSVLLSKMITILMENAGAGRGFLILPDKNKQLVIQAEMENADPKVLQAIPVEQSEHLSQSIVRYVAGSKKHIVLDNASESRDFASDEYIDRYKPQSLLCIPIVNQRTLKAVLYLENNLVSGAFTSERVQMLDLLSTQAAISIENAQVLEENKILVQEQQSTMRQIEKSLEEKETLLKELYHRTKNNMQLILSMLYLSGTTYESNSQVQQLIKETENRIHSMSLVHQKLVESNDLSQIDLQNYILDLLPMIMASYPKVKDRISITYDVNSISSLIDTAIPLGLILNELMTNVIKHAFPDNHKGTIIVRLHQYDKEHLLLEFSDDGVGVSKDFDFRNQSGIGLQTIITIAENQMQGELHTDTSSGFSVRILFPDSLYVQRV